MAVMALSDLCSSGGEVRVDVLVFEGPLKSFDEDAAGGSD